MIATLPEGCRPIRSMEFPVVTNGNLIGRITINPSGTIVLGSGNTGYVSLCSIPAFLVEA